MPLSEHEMKAFREQAEIALKRRKREKEEEKHRQELENELRAQRTAAEKEALLRKDALRVWVQEGGTPAEFEKQWDKIHEALIFQRTVNRVSGGDQGHSLGWEIKL